MTAGIARSASGPNAARSTSPTSFLALLTHPPTLLSTFSKNFVPPSTLALAPFDNNGVLSPTSLSSRTSSSLPSSSPSASPSPLVSSPNTVTFPSPSLSIACTLDNKDPTVLCVGVGPSSSGQLPISAPGPADVVVLGLRKVIPEGLASVKFDELDTPSVFA